MFIHRRTRRNRLTALIEAGCRIEGELTFAGTVRLDGSVKGAIRSQGVLVLGKNAVVEGSIDADVVRVAGEITGRVTVKERLELQRTGRVHGEVEAPVFIIEAGGVFDGECRMPGQAAAEPQAEVTEHRAAASALGGRLLRPLRARAMSAPAPDTEHR